MKFRVPFTHQSVKFEVKIVTDTDEMELGIAGLRGKSIFNLYICLMVLDIDLEIGPIDWFIPEIRMTSTGHEQTIWVKNPKYKDSHPKMFSFPRI